ncbi:type III secretion system cytoplasmic ring protein SctQ [Stenotrophomonas maltophilia]
MAQLSEAAAAEADAAAQCRAAGLDPAWRTASPTGAVLRFSVTTASLQMIVQLAADEWLAAHWPGLAGVAWSALDIGQVLRRFMPEGPLLQLQAPALCTAEVALLGAAVARCDERAAARPALATAQGWAWLEQARCLQPSAAAAPSASLRRDLPLQLDLHIARLSLPVARLRALRSGAVLLLAPMAAVARVGRAALCTFEFTLETFTVNDTLDFLEDDEAAASVPAEPLPAEATDAIAPALDTARLPVTLEVVLCQMPLTVGDLDALQPGALFNLPHDAWKQIQLRVNGQRIASGELVQVGEQLGVLLHHPAPGA